jgi:hypothetical protein
MVRNTGIAPVGVETDVTQGRWSAAVERCFSVCGWSPAGSKTTLGAVCCSLSSVEGEG